MDWLPGRSISLVISNAPYVSAVPLTWARLTTVASMTESSILILQAYNEVLFLWKAYFGVQNAKEPELFMGRFHMSKGAKRLLHWNTSPYPLLLCLRKHAATLCSKSILKYFFPHNSWSCPLSLADTRPTEPFQSSRRVRCWLGRKPFWVACSEAPHLWFSFPRIPDPHL